MNIWMTLVRAWSFISVKVGIFFWRFLFCNGSSSWKSLEFLYCESSTISFLGWFRFSKNQPIFFKILAWEIQIFSTDFWQISHHQSNGYFFAVNIWKQSTMHFTPLPSCKSQKFFLLLFMFAKKSSFNIYLYSYEKHNKESNELGNAIKILQCNL